MLQEAILTESSLWLLQLIREEGMIWEEEKTLFFSSRLPHLYKTRHSPPRYIWNQLQNGYQWRWALDLDDLTEKLGTANSLNLL